MHHHYNFAQQTCWRSIESQWGESTGTKVENNYKAIYCESCFIRWACWTIQEAIVHQPEEVMLLDHRVKLNTHSHRVRCTPMSYDEWMEILLKSQIFLKEILNTHFSEPWISYIDAFARYIEATEKAGVNLIRVIDASGLSWRLSTSPCTRRQCNENLIELYVLIIRLKEELATYGMVSCSLADMYSCFMQIKIVRNITVIWIIAYWK